MPITRNGMMLASLKRGTSQIAFVFQGTTQIWAHEIVVVLAAYGASTYMAPMFDPDVWASSTPKRVVIPLGVERGSSSSWVIGVVSGGEQADSFGGTLVLENRGTLSGRGGAANSGAGGNVVWANAPGKDGQQLIVRNYGIIRAGGGGGGKGGNGGAGTYNYNYREPSSGWRYINDVGAPAGVRTFWSAFTDEGTEYVSAWWDGYANATGSNVAATSLTSGGWTYLRGTAVNSTIFRIARQQTRSASSTGGIAGDAGRGQGYDGAAATGAAAVAGGTNAGASGKSGNGGAYGASGQAGASGANGNAGSGTAGAAGGLAGFAITALGTNATLENHGTIIGRT